MSEEAPVLEPLGPGLWVASRHLKLRVGDIGARMTVIQLSDGGLVLHSPVRLDGETRAALDALGPVRALVAPNLHHHFFVRAYTRAYPEARLYGAPGLREKRPDLRFDAVLGDETPREWRGEIDQRPFRGAPDISEVVFHHQASRTLVLADLAFNVPPGATGARLFHWLIGARGRFGPHRLVRFAIRDRRAAHASLQEILRWDFERIVVAHGEVLTTGAKERLAVAFAFLGRP